LLLRDRIDDLDHEGGAMTKLKWPSIAALFAAVLVIAPRVHAFNVVNNGGGGGGAAASPTSCTDQVATGTPTVTWTAGHTYCFQAGTTQFAAAQSISANNVTIYCSTKAAIIQRTGSTDLFDVSGNYFQLIGCALDGNSQSGSGTGPLVKITGTDGLVQANLIQNAGVTNPTVAAIDVEPTGSRARILSNTFAASTDQSVGVNIINSTGGPTTGVIVANNLVTSFNPGNASLSAIRFTDHNGAVPINDLLVEGNVIYAAGANASAMSFGGAVGASSTGDKYIANTVHATARLGTGFFHYGATNMVMVGNVVNFVNGTVDNAAFGLGDQYGAVVADNTIEDGASYSGAFGIACYDCGKTRIDSNNIYNMYGVGILVTPIGVNENDNAVSNNHVAFASGKTGSCYKLSTSSANTMTDTQIVGNHCTGDGTASQIGVTEASGGAALTNTMVSGNFFTKVATGILNASGITGDVWVHNYFDSVLTPYSIGNAARIVDLGANTLLAAADCTGSHTPVYCCTAASTGATCGLPTLTNGSMMFVPDATIANPCASGGSGAILKELNGTNVCN
jgi:hypothetical protein